MSFTTVSIISIIFNVIFISALVWLLIQFLKQKKQIKNLVKELDSDSLEHYLNEIKKRGFEFTLKPKKKKEEKEILN